MRWPTRLAPGQFRNAGNDFRLATSKYFSPRNLILFECDQKGIYPLKIAHPATQILYRFWLFDIVVATSKMANEVGGSENGFISEPSCALSFQVSPERMRDNWRAIFKLFGFAIARMLVLSSPCSISTIQPL